MDVMYLIKYQLNIYNATWDPGSGIGLGVRIQEGVSQTLSMVI